MIYNNDTISSTPNSNWLITINEAKQYLKTDNTLETSLSGFLVATIQLISDKFEHYIGKGIIAQNYIGYYDGTGNEKLYTENYPINSISTLQYRDSPQSNWTNFYNDSSSSNILSYTNHIYLYSNNFPHGRKNIKVEFNAGYEATPGDIKQCVLEAVQEHYNHSKYGNDTLGYKSKNIGGQIGTSETYEELWQKHKKVLDSYKSITI